MKTCPYCQSHDEQVKNGLNPSGTQRYQCNRCQRSYTPQPKQHGYAPALREQAIQYYVDGINLCRIARMLGVNHQTVANWVNAHVRPLPTPPYPNSRRRWSWTSSSPSWRKKNTAYIMTAVDRASHCIVGWAVVWDRSGAVLQTLLDTSPYAQRYYSDAFNLY